MLLDVAGTVLTPADRRRLVHPLVGGVILFTRNWRSRRQLTALTAAIKAERPDALICIDHEGGRVQRLRGDGMTVLPPMRRLGELWLDDALAATDAASATGYVLGAELRACGVDLSFTPVLDLDHGRSAVIGDRALAADPRVVALLAKSLVQGMSMAGLQHCAKHFPGHGHAAADSHVDVPVDERPLEAILAADARPYGWLATVLQAVMPAHVVYPAVDGRPAGFSRRWLRDVLRREMGYTGAIISDDLSMEGARRLEGRQLDAPDAAMLALRAGCDLALLCNQSLGDGAVLDAFLARLDAGRLARAWRPSGESEARRLALLPTAPAPSWAALMRQPRYRLARSKLPGYAEISAAKQSTSTPRQ